MTVSTSVHSNALNFMSCLKSGVDPRTGLYNVSINLPELQGNDLLGPGITPALSYSPLNTQDSGYGLGWGLQLSHYNPGTNILSLSTGETFCIDGSAGSKGSERTTRVGRLTMSEQKLDTFHFYKLDETRFRVVHKSGLTEILEVHRSGDKRMAWPVRIIAPSGHSLRLEHKPFNSTQFMLESIKDDQDQPLLNIIRSSTSVEITLYPEAATEDGQLARFVMSLTGTDKRVSRITLPTENAASWRFEYGFENDSQLCIKRVETPTGSQEDVYYQDGGHEFPASAKRPALPRVTRHIVDPGFSQPKVDVRYTYKDSQQRSRNFLGAGLSIYWEDNGLDNLYKYVNPYDYVCTESLWVDDKPVRSIERTFNRFHLQTLEVTTQNEHRQTVETLYFIEEGVPFDRQLSYCQLPKEINTSWTVLSEPGRVRNEKQSNTYDSAGNLLEHTRADGIVETSTWYPAEGVEGDCPADPEGFVSRLRTRTTTPAQSDEVDAPILSTHYRYAEFPALTDSEMPIGMIPETETLVQIDTEGAGNDVELRHTRLTHFNRPDEPFLHGRVERQSLRLNGQSTHIDYAYSNLDSPQLEVPVQQITQTLSTDFDSVTSVTVRQLSPLTGQELVALAEGVETRYAYDALNRMTREVVASGQEFEASREYQYVLCATSGEQAEQVTINARKVMTRSRMDGLGRVIYEEQDHIDADNLTAVLQIYAAQYSTWNNVEQETTYDYLGHEPLILNRRFTYDDWNQQCVVTGDDGVQNHQHFDPIGSDDYAGPIQRSWLQCGSDTPKISNCSETWLNLFGKPQQISSLDSSEKITGTQSFKYDGLGRCTCQTDEAGYSTQFSYDAWSRMTTTTLPDESVINRSYATHSSDELATTLEVVHSDGTTKTLAGKQNFDGLQRLTSSTVGPRVENYAYEGDRKQVKTRTTAKGEAINFTYNLALTDQALTSTAPDENAEYDYDATSARLIRAHNNQGTRTYDYDALNRLQVESWIDNQGTPWKTRYQTSLQKRPLKRIELEEGASTGLDTLYHYDAFGRLDCIDQGTLKASITYDDFSRPGSVVTHDLTAGTALATRFEYDHQGRETLRAQALNQQPERILEQVWQADGLLASRHLQQGSESLLLENFTYDARGRLTLHECSGSTLPRETWHPVDTEPRAIIRQLFTFDSLDNITLTTTTFADDTIERAFFTYAVQDPCQLSGVTYRPSRVRKEPITPMLDPTFRYDENGNQLNDEQGHTLSYDSQSRLLGVLDTAGRSLSEYRYDSHDHLVTSRHGSDSETLRFYQDQQLSCSVQDDRRTHYLYLGEQSLGQQCENQEDETLLLLTDPNNSVLGECQQDTLRTAVYSAYGNRHSDEPLLTTLGFNGEVRDASSGWYLLGRGYRAYNPVLMRFHSPDSLSPFAAGGVNPYTYCLGNPIALRDPTGHDASVQSGRLRRPDEGELYPGSAGGGGVMGWVGVAVGAFFTVVGVASLAMTAGLAAPVSIPLIGLGVAETTSATVALVATTALTAASTAAGAVNATNGDQTAGSIALWTGVAAFGVGLGTGAASSAMRALSKPVNDKGIKNLILAGVSRAPSPAGSPGLAARASSRIPQPGSPAGSLSAAPVAVTAPGVSSTSAITRPAMAPAILAGAKAKLRPAAPTQAANAGDLDEMRLAIQARLKGDSARQAIEAAKAANGRSAMMDGIIAQEASLGVGGIRA
ncbi:sugar-binding protein [Pseudomonas congelans]|uniref:RHS repeat-associated core domain-containing protein n=1 Tax=Pseudomonas congelans TaxID=200452 RepID=UPI000BB6D33C|nr:RHS repeat-associated core domain-containing protein [Pseudomonas congelans]PBQ20123.1 sugar-binding protein [Pseudomonas congelans]